MIYIIAIDQKILKCIQFILHVYIRIPIGKKLNLCKKHTQTHLTCTHTCTHGHTQQKQQETQNQYLYMFTCL